MPVGGSIGGALSLRLPKRRDQLKITEGASGPGRTAPFGPTVGQHLSELYRNAAKELESSGRVDEAAFVLAELLNDSMLCIALWERHKRYHQAASLAENRALAAELRVRLWWLAGEHDRASRTARQHQVLGAVITRLEHTDKEAARAFRLSWVDQLEQSGDLEGAVAAGWPDETIRPLLINVIDRGIQNGGQQANGLLAYRAALRPTDENRAALFSSLEDSAVTSRIVRTIAIAVSEVRSAQPNADREIATRTLRALTRINQPHSDKQLTKAHLKLQKRCDQLLRADLPTPIRPNVVPATVVIGEHMPGNAEIHDVAPLGGGETLIALGELGCRLLTADGRVKARWDVPCHRLVPADHSGIVILVRPTEFDYETYVLDLTTRRHRYYGTIYSELWVSSFDGMSWPVVDSKGIAYLDILADTPTVAWRELEPGWICHQVARSSESMAAVVTVKHQPHLGRRVEIWRWNLPSRRLTDRGLAQPVSGARLLHLLADGTAIWERPDSQLVEVTVSESGPHSKAVDTSIAPTDDLATSGAYLAKRRADGRLIVTEGLDGDPVVEVENLDSKWGFRSHNNLVAIWDAAGRYYVVDNDTGQLEVTGRVLL